MWDVNRVEKEERRKGGVLWVTVWADLVMDGVEEVFQMSWLLINKMKRKTAENDEKDTGKKKKSVNILKNGDYGECGTAVQVLT